MHLILPRAMRERGIRGSFASDGITAELTGLLEQGLFETLYEVQSFDLTAAESLRRNAGHREMSAARYADPGVAGNIAGQLDIMILSAAEIDCSFNLNSLTGTNGRIVADRCRAPLDAGQDSYRALAGADCLYSRFESRRSGDRTGYRGEPPEGGPD